MGPIGRFAVVVDDDASVARAIARLLRSANITVDTFTTGTALLARMEAQPSYLPACVILDVSMPEMDGLEVQRRLAGRASAVIFITAHDLPETRDKALASGAIGYLRKPFNGRQLIELVRGTLM